MGQRNRACNSGFHLFPWSRKNVADTANGFDVLIVIGISQLLADLAHMHVDAAVEGREFSAEYGVHQPFARNDSTRFAQQYFEQIEFDRG